MSKHSAKDSTDINDYHETMKYAAFKIQNYRAIEKPVTINLQKSSLIPLVGINECGKTTILQGIYCFDFINDDEYKGKHLNDTKNLYKTQDSNPPIITATIITNYAELNRHYINYIKEKGNLSANNETNTSLQSEALSGRMIAASIRNDLKSIQSQITNSIQISRDLTTKSYSFENIAWPAEYSVGLISNFAKFIVQRLPYILYNDDFMDRPPVSITIPKEKPSTLNGWLAIYERLFNVTSKGYSLFNVVDEKDTRRRDAIISDVESTLNDTLTKAWKSFLLSSHGAVTVRLRLIENDGIHELEARVVEKSEGRERFFDVIDRSKGFLWFFNFVMKLEFNPKIEGGHADTVYLLDEPGSYLHYSAQEKLCKKLVKLSTNHGSVIYCTHSHALLNPELIPLNQVYIIEKRKNKQILATPLPQIKTTAEATMALQPIHEALQTSAFALSKTSDAVVVVEGIYDKYAIECVIDLDTGITILPSTSADAVLKNIQFLNGFEMKYVAIWDNDTEGMRAYNKAVKIYGQEEAERFDLLPSSEKPYRRMEEMFLPHDLITLSTELDLSTSAIYERVISAFYFAPQSKRKNLRKMLSPETISRFETLHAIIRKRFAKGDELKSNRI